MNSRTRTVLAVAAFAVVALGAITFAVRSSRTPTSQTPAEEAAKRAKESEIAGLSIKGAGVEQRDAQGKLQWRVTAGGQMGFDKQKQTVVGKQVRFEVIQQDKPTVVVRAPQFEADYRNRKLVFQQGVNGDLGQPGQGTFAVNRIDYDLSTGKLVGSGGAKFVRGQYSAEAPQIVVDTKTKHVRMSGGVTFTRQ